jgi:3,4-dihydroxyphenylacetate 2,3-dioxygenase
MGEIVGAALVSHHPGLFQSDEFRVRMGDGQDSDLIAGFARLRARIDVARPSTLVIFDTHWFTTGFHLIDAGAEYAGDYISDEMPWYLRGQKYAYLGNPALAQQIEQVAVERGVMSKAAAPLRDHQCRQQALPRRARGLGQHLPELSAAPLPGVGQRDCRGDRAQR